MQQSPSENANFQHRQDISRSLGFWLPNKRSVRCQSNIPVHMSGRGRSHVLASAWYIQAAHSLKPQSVFSRAHASNAKHFLLCATCKKRLCAIYEMEGWDIFQSSRMKTAATYQKNEHELFTFKYRYWYLSVKQWVSKINTGKWWSRSCAKKEKKPRLWYYSAYTSYPMIMPAQIPEGRKVGGKEGRKKERWHLDHWEERASDTFYLLVF